MKQLFVNLKRFDVPRSMGGLCPVEDPQAWAQSIIEQSIQLGLGTSELHFTYLFPEGLASIAASRLRAFPARQTSSLETGCQGVHWQDVEPGGNFGAFTTSLPATAARNLGCAWTIVGHSEERRKLLQVLKTYDARLDSDEALISQANQAVSRLVNASVKCALRAGLKVLVCVGETAEERGEGSFEQQQPRILQALTTQLALSLEGISDLSSRPELVIGYEPVWAIGPGKTPPGQEYIHFVSSAIKEIVNQNFHFIPPVVYGGGLKEENAAMLAGIPTIDGGLVALTRFTGQIGFDVDGLARIAERYHTAVQNREEEVLS